MEVSTEDKANFFIMTNLSMEEANRVSSKAKSCERSDHLSVHPSICRSSIHPSTYLLKKRESDSANCSCSSFAIVS